MRDSFLNIVFLLFPLSFIAQNNVVIKSEFIFNNKRIEIDKDYVSSNKDTLSFETLKLYLSNFQFTYQDNSVEKIKSSYFLLDINEPESLNLKLEKKSNKKIKSIQFNIGIDSLTNVSGALGGCLDATNGMYWAWQSGYINFKIEGKSNSCMTRKNKFQFHIGGYLKPYYSLRPLNLLVKNDEINKDYLLIIDISKLFSNINLKKFNTVMIPCEEAMVVSDWFQNSLTLE